MLFGDRKGARGTAPAPTAGMLVAALALALAFGTTALAGDEQAKRPVSKSEVKRISTKQARKEIRKQAPELEVAHADRATIGESPLAYAYVNADGTVDAASSRGVTNANVSNSPNFLGVYCIDGLSKARTAMVAAETAEAPAPEGPGLVNVSIGGAHLCPGAQFRVQTYVSDGGVEGADTPFLIWFFG